jgi:hypothetical protein
MNKNELTLEQAKIAASRYKETLIFLTFCARIVGALGVTYIIMAGLREIAGANPEGIKAIALVVKELKLSAVMGYILAGGCAGGWYLERKGKKRMLASEAAARRQRELDDPYSSSADGTGEN